MFDLCIIMIFCETGTDDMLNGVYVADMSFLLNSLCHLGDLLRCWMMSCEWLRTWCSVLCWHLAFAMQYMHSFQIRHDVNVMIHISDYQSYAQYQIYVETYNLETIWQKPYGNNKYLHPVFGCHPYCTAILDPCLYKIWAYLTINAWDIPKATSKEISNNMHMWYSYIIGIQHVCHRTLAYGSHIELAYCIAR